MTVAPKPYASETNTALVYGYTAQGTVLAATVTAASTGQPMVTGSVSFYNGTTFLGTAPVINGVASMNIPGWLGSSIDLLAVYSGSGAYGPSSSSAKFLSEGPQVVGLSRYGFHARPTVLVLNFNSPLDPVRAQDVSNYVIVNEYGKRIDVKSASYDAATQTVTLLPSQKLKVRRTYTLTVIGTGPNGLTSSSGLPLDGAGTSHPESDFTAKIRWTALTLPGCPPAVTYFNGQETHTIGGKMNNYLNAFMRAFRAATH